jgi:putative ABC transport system ATP-binding protein
MIQASNLSYMYPDSTFQLQLADWNVSQGEQLAIVGPSGSGKTTLVNLLAGILRPSEGQLRVGQWQLDEMSERQRRAMRASSIGQVFQDFELIDYLTVQENVLLPYLINGSLTRTADVDRRIESLADRVGIQSLLSRRPGKLSHGERQRVAAIRALVAEPQLVLADEPTASLDAENKFQLLELLSDSCRELAATLVIVTHDEAVADRMESRLDLSSQLAARV